MEAIIETEDHDGLRLVAGDGGEFALAVRANGDIVFREMREFDEYAILDMQRVVTFARVCWDAPDFDGELPPRLPGFTVSYEELDMADSEHAIHVLARDGKLYA